MNNVLNPNPLQKSTIYKNYVILSIFYNLEFSNSVLTFKTEVWAVTNSGSSRLNIHVDVKLLLLLI